jgi:chemotaxis signal transduction protein
MSQELSALSSRASVLKKAFDDSFAQPVGLNQEHFENVLAIRIAGLPHAVRLAEVAGLHVNRRITRLPSSFAGFLGVTSLRGSFLPVYDLRILLGHASPEPPPWLIVSAGAPVGLAFDAFDAHHRVRRENEAVGQKLQGASHTHSYAHEVLDIAGNKLPVLSVAGVCAHIRSHSPSAATKL